MFKSRLVQSLALAAALASMFAAGPSQALICQYCSYNGPSLEGRAQVGFEAAEIAAIELPE